MSRAVDKAMQRFHEALTLRQCAEAIEGALPIIRAMFEAFPYAEKDGDDEALQKLADAGKKAREYFNKIAEKANL